MENDRLREAEPRAQRIPRLSLGTRSERELIVWIEIHTTESETIPPARGVAAGAWGCCQSPLLVI